MSIEQTERIALLEKLLAANDKLIAQQDAYIANAVELVRTMEKCLAVQEKILDGVADALHGTRPGQVKWAHHTLPELAAHTMAKLTACRARMVDDDPA